MTHDLTHQRNDLRHALAELLDPQRHMVLRENGTTTIHTAPSLLLQLERATANGGEIRRSGGRRGTPLPIAVDATDALIKITREAGRLHRQVLTRQYGDPAPIIRAAADIASRWDDAPSLQWITDQLQAWAAAIRAVLDPPRRLHLAAPCPACRARMVLRTDDTGEQVQTPALTVDSDRGADCLACNAHWPPGHFDHLARDIARLDSDNDQTAS